MTVSHPLKCKYFTNSSGALLKGRKRHTPSPTGHANSLNSLSSCFAACRVVSASYLALKYPNPMDYQNCRAVQPSEKRDLLIYLDLYDLPSCHIQTQNKSLSDQLIDMTHRTYDCPLQVYRKSKHTSNLDQQQSRA